MAIAWLVLAVVLLWIELHHLAFFALFASVGSLAAGAVALVSARGFVLQGAVFAGVTVVGVTALRPLVSSVYERRHPGGLRIKGVHGGLVGQETVTLDRVGSAHEVGHVLLAGERWLAVSGDTKPIDAGRRVTVTDVVGTTLVVWPLDDLYTFAEPTTNETP